MADGVGFEPTEGCPSTVFKTAAIDHSAIHPSCVALFRINENSCNIKKIKKQVEKLLKLIYSTKDDKGVYIEIQIRIFYFYVFRSMPIPTSQQWF